MSCKRFPEVVPLEYNLIKKNHLKISVVCHFVILVRDSNFAFAMKLTTKLRLNDRIPVHLYG